jgi:hypothetical protein
MGAQIMLDAVLCYRARGWRVFPVNGRRLYRVADLKAWVEGLEGRDAI